MFPRNNWTSCAAGNSQIGSVGTSEVRELVQPAAAQVPAKRWGEARGDHHGHDRVEDRRAGRRVGAGPDMLIRVSKT